MFLISASNVTHTTFRPVGLTISHSGVKGYPDHFWAGRAQTKKQKDMAPFGIRSHSSLNAQRFITSTVQTYEITP
jgi:hypothetical protein